MGTDDTAAAQALLSLLKASLAGEHAPQGGEVLEQVLPLAKAHAVVSLLYEPLAPLPEEPAGPWLELRRKAQQCAVQYYRLLTVTKHWVDVFARSGIPTAVLKGAGAAMAYPVPEMRKSGDIDLLLLREEDFPAARELLLAEGATLAPDQHARHHVGFLLPQGMELELHLQLTEDFGDCRADARLKALQQELAAGAASREVFPRVSLPLLPEGGQALSLLLHMLSHFRGSGFGLKLLCDWTAFWRQPVSEEAVGWYLQVIAECGLEGFSAGVTRVCVDALGLPEDRVRPLLEQAEVSPGTSDALLEEVLRSEEFGKTGEGRLVLVRTPGPAGYIREFHRQTGRNFPRAVKCPLLWPGLWSATLVRFLHNNHRLRGVSAKAVLHSASDRGKLARQLHLFHS